MSSFNSLMSQKFILKAKDFDQYYLVKDNLKTIKKDYLDKFGYGIYINQSLIKLEKVPGKPEPWMGILDFSSIEEYQMLCYLLMFLEDMEIANQFVLSNLLEFIQVKFVDNPITFNDFSVRKKLIRVVKYAIKIGIIINNAGDEDKFSQNIQTEVLFENTGVSRYFLRSFVTDILQWDNVSDFFDNQYLNMDEDRGIVRTHRVYRRLLLSPCIYRSDGNDEDFNYIRNYRNRIEKDFQKLFSCDLHVYKSCAFLVIDEDVKIGKFIDNKNAMDDILLLFNYEVIKRVKNNSLKINSIDKIIVNEYMINLIIDYVIKNNFDYIPKAYQVNNNLSSDVLNRLIVLGYVTLNDAIYTINPIVKILGGNYEMEKS